MPKKFVGSTEIKSNFFPVPNQLSRDASLSFRARGILIYILSHKDGWNLSAKSLAQQTTEGERAVRTALDELANAGYLSRPLLRNETGKFVTYYLLSISEDTKSRIAELQSATAALGMHTPKKSRKKRSTSSKKGSPNTTLASRIVTEEWRPRVKGKTAQREIGVVGLVTTALDNGSSEEELRQALRTCAEYTEYGPLTGLGLNRVLKGGLPHMKVDPANRKSYPGKYSTVL